MPTPDLSRSPDDYASPEAYAHAMATLAAHHPERDCWAVGGGSPDEAPHVEVEYAIEPRRGSGPHMTDTELAGPIENLPSFADGARLITREITYGPWRYVTPKEIENA